MVERRSLELPGESRRLKGTCWSHRNATLYLSEFRIPLARNPMIHRLTLPCEILRDYERRNVFTRFHWGSQHPMMNDISVKISTDEMRILLTDAEDHITVRAAGYPNLAIAYHKFAEKLRAVLRKSGETQSPEIGRDGKSAAAHDYD